MASSVRTDGVHLLKQRSLSLDRADRIGRFLATIGKFAVDSAVNESRKFVTGGKKVYQIVQEGLKERPLLHSLSRKKKQNDVKLVEKMQPKTYRTHEENMNEVKQHIHEESSAKAARQADPPKKVPEDGINEAALPIPKQKRIFIRSRL